MPTDYRFVFIIKQGKLLSHHRRSAIGSADQSFQAQIVKVAQEELAKVAFKWVIAVAKNGFSLKVFFVVIQLILNILILRIELVFLRILGLCRFSFFAISFPRSRVCGYPYINTSRKKRQQNVLMV